MDRALFRRIGCEDLCDGAHRCFIGDEGRIPDDRYLYSTRKTGIDARFDMDPDTADRDRQMAHVSVAKLNPHLVARRPLLLELL